MLSRRGVFARLFGAVAGGAIAARTASAKSTDVPRVAYHLADLEKVAFVLGNIENHIAGVGGPENVEIVLVVHGPALAAFHARKANADFERRLARIVAASVGLAACGNTLDAQKVSVADLLPGFVRIDEGGVVRLARLQAEGYAYLRP